MAIGLSSALRAKPKRRRLPVGRQALALAAAVQIVPTAKSAHPKFSYFLVANPGAVRVILKASIDYGR